MSKVNAPRNSPLSYCTACLIYMETKLTYSKSSMYFKFSKTIKTHTFLLWEVLHIETKIIYSKPSMYFKNSKTIKKNKSTHFLMRSVTFTTFSQQIIAGKLLSDQIWTKH